MPVRIALTETPSAEGRTDAFVISWPLENDPRHMTAGASEAVRREVGGLPAVLVALDSNREIHTFGDLRHVLALLEIGLETHSWAHFDIDLPRAPLVSLPARRSEPPAIAA